MVEFQKELMTAILVASTAFAGLTGVVIGQIIASSASIKMKRRLKNFLIGSFFLGIAAIVFVIAWFISLQDIYADLAIIVFLIQVTCFWATAVYFWRVE